jgi:hypothetical protein
MGVGWTWWGLVQCPVVQGGLSVNDREKSGGVRACNLSGIGLAPDAPAFMGKVDL